MPEHFVTPPRWEWYILGYFFLAGIAGGAYAIGTMLRLWGDRRDEGAARLAFLISFPALVLCPLLLTVDLGKPLRFWHMLVDTGSGTLAFKYWSPMSLGAWVLTVFGIFATVSFVEALVVERQIKHPLAGRLTAILGGAFGRVFMVVGTILGLFLAGYTGVLLSVSNQPVWSDSWALGGLFLASGLSAAAATTGLWAWNRRQTATHEKLSEADRYFILIELVLLALFFITLGGVISKVLTGGWLVLWLLVLVGTLVPLAVYFRPAWGRQVPPVVATALILVGVLALRAVVIFSAQS